MRVCGMQCGRQKQQQIVYNSSVPHASYHKMLSYAISLRLLAPLRRSFWLFPLGSPAPWLPGPLAPHHPSVTFQYFLQLSRSHCVAPLCHSPSGQSINLTAVICGQRRKVCASCHACTRGYNNNYTTKNNNNICNNKNTNINAYTNNNILGTRAIKAYIGMLYSPREVVFPKSNLVDPICGKYIKWIPIFCTISSLTHLSDRSIGIYLHIKS